MTFEMGLVFLVLFITIILFALEVFPVDKIAFFIIVSLTFLVLSPYMIRNYVTFKQIILVKSFGYNLWKGNNELSTVEGYQNQRHPNFATLEKKLNSIVRGKQR